MLRREEREPLLELLDGWQLSDGWRGRDFFRRYIEDDPTFSDKNVWVAVADGRPVSCVQIFPRRMRVLGHAVPIGGIGSVFTRPDQRGRGLATVLLEHAIPAMSERGMELSLLFGGQSLYERQGFRSWVGQRTVVRLVADRPQPESLGAVELAKFDRTRHFAAVKAVHSAYSASRNGTLVRNEALWDASLRLAGNPNEEFRVAERDSKLIAYARATLLDEVLTVTELGRLDDGAEALAWLLESLLVPREDDPLVPLGHDSKAVRSFAVLPAFDDLMLTVSLEQRGVSAHPLDDPSAMIRCLSARGLAERLGVSLLPDETSEEFVRRMLPADSFVFWPADRF